MMKGLLVYIERCLDVTGFVWIGLLGRELYENLSFTYYVSYINISWT